MDVKDIKSLAERLNRNPRSAYSFGVDLHVHTHESHDVTSELTEDPESFLQALSDSGMRLVAITDHNTGKYIDRAIEASKNLGQNDKARISVLPGVELTVYPGIHILAILPGGGTGAVSELLAVLGVDSTAQGKKETVVQRSMEQVADEVHKRGGLVIAAHCHSSSGLINELEGQSRVQALQVVDALEYKPDTVNLEKKQRYVREQLSRELPFVYGSDMHDTVPNEPPMHLKMADVSLNGVRQITFDAADRISRHQVDVESRQWIYGLAVTGGLLAGNPIRFSPEFNVLIGGRGAGKSALLDLLRFAWNDLPSDARLRPRFTERVAGFLGPVNSVVARARGVDGNEYVIVRSGDRSGHGPTLAFTSAPTVYQISESGDLIRREVTPREVCPVTFFGQGEIQQLASTESDHARLVVGDDQELADLSTEISELDDQLDEIEIAIVGLTNDIDELKRQCADKPGLETRLEELKKFLSDSIFEEKARWDTDLRMISGFQSWSEQAGNGFTANLPNPTESNVNDMTDAGRQIYEAAQTESKSILETAEQALETHKVNLQEFKGTLSSRQEKWTKEHDGFLDRYRQRLKELDAEDLDSVSDERTTAEADLHEIADALEPKLDAKEKQLAEKVKKRNEDLKLLALSRTNHEEKTAEIVERVNDRLPEAVQVQFGRTHDDTSIRSLLAMGLLGSGARRQDDLVDQLSKQSPADLGRIFRANDIDALTGSGLSTAAAGSVLSSLDQSGIMKIERAYRRPIVTVTLKRAGDPEYTDLNHLSVGEMCSAVLSLILLDLSEPLVVDQPEDDLDHEFLVSSVVESLKSIKSIRQVVSATHNPNLPVLGDAELVIKMQKTPAVENCQVQLAGGLEIPSVSSQVQMLEGGEKAFERRYARYQSTKK